jgi:hypothetical protein
VRDLQLIEQLGPVGEAVLGRDGLRRVAGHGHRSLRRRGLQQDGQLDRREVLHLVDHEVLVGERRRSFSARERAALELVDAQQERVVLGVEGEALAVVLEPTARPQAVARDTPAVMSSSCLGENSPGVPSSRSALRSVSMLAHSLTTSRVRSRSARPILQRHARRGTSDAARAHCASTSRARPQCPRLVPRRQRRPGHLGGQPLAAPGRQRHRRLSR